jgi:hypothetical protein
VTAAEQLALFLLLARVRGQEARRTDAPETQVEGELPFAREAWLQGWREAEEFVQVSEAIKHARRQHRLLTGLVYDLLVKLDGVTLFRCGQHGCIHHATRVFRSKEFENTRYYRCDHHKPDDAHREPQPLQYSAVLRELLEVGAAGGVRYIQSDQGHLANGLYDKYVIQKADGLPVDPRAHYFVLRYDTDPHAKVALRAYADAIRIRNPRLASDIDAALAAAPGDKT